MEGTLTMEYRFNITAAGYGRDEAHGEQALDAFLAKHESTGPVVGQHADDDTLTVVFSIDSDTFDGVVDRGLRIWSEAISGTVLEGAPIVAMHVDVVLAERELEPA